MAGGHQIVLDVLRSNRRPFSRASLASAATISERDVRRAIADLNSEGYPVVQTGRGFILAERPQTVLRAARCLRAQAASLLRRARDLDEIVERMVEP